MQLRRATSADYLHVASWIADADACRLWAGPLVPFPFLARELPKLLALDGGASYCLGAVGAEPLGFGQCWPRIDGSAHLLRIIVAPQQRRQGLGRTLCRELIARAADAGATAVTLNVYPENLGAVALYESLGFRPDDSRPTRDSLFMRLPVG
jgi:ribosomal protein S18 acetylase RimI-like enzyme